MTRTPDAFFIRSRRKFLVSGIALVSGVGVWGIWPNSGQAGDTISVTDAHRLALNGQITLIDIRRPGEWARTGSGQGAYRLDMRRRDFEKKLDKLLAGDRSKPVAVICARGARSGKMSQRLSAAGFTNVIDVPEGMLGSTAGPGWLRRGLPVEK